MIITDVRVVNTSPQRNYTIVRIDCDGGRYGLGDATLPGRELVVAGYVRDYLRPALIGRDSRDIEDIWQFLRTESYWGNGPIGWAACSGVDMALWDMKGKFLGVPVYDLLGGRCRDHVTLYAHVAGADIDDVLTNAKARMSEGYRALRLQCVVPGAGTYGTRSTERPLGDVAERWDPAPYLRLVPRLFEAARAELGNDVHLIHDAHHRLTATEAARLAVSLEPYHLTWLEDPVAPGDPAGCRFVRAHSRTPLAGGELAGSLSDLSDLIGGGLVDYVRPGVAHAGGITGIRKIAAYAEHHHVKLALHHAAAMSPIALAASIHLGLSTFVAALQEYVPYDGTVDDVFRTDHRIANGSALPGSAPGLGVDMDDEAALHYPHSISVLPLMRHIDGTVGHW